MSLINQMLKDLEQRNAASNHIKKIPTNLSATSPRHSTFPYISLALLIAILAAVAYWWVLSRTPPQALPAKVEMQPAALNKTAPAIKADEITDVATMTEPVAQLELNESALNAPALVDSTIQKSMPIANAEPSSNQSEMLKPQTKKIQNEKIPDDFLPEAKPAKHLATVHTASKSSSASNQNSLTVGKQFRPDQKSANDYRQALSNLQQGRVAEAQANLILALEANPSNHEARQTLAALLLDNKRNDEAKAILVAGLDIAPEQNDFRMAVARLELEAGDQAGALNTLEQGSSYAKSNADYQGFLATLLQRAERHEEAIDYYMTALSLKSDSTSALIGLGISLRAVGKFENAQEVFNRAQSSNALSPELSQFVNQQLKEINQHINQANSQ